MYTNGESAVILPNGIHYTRYLMNIVIGTEAANDGFNFCEKLNEINLTDTEKVLTFLVVMTSFSKLDFNEYFFCFK